MNKKNKSSSKHRPDSLKDSIEVPKIKWCQSVFPEPFGKYRKLQHQRSTRLTNNFLHNCEISVNEKCEFD